MRFKNHLVLKFCLLFFIHLAICQEKQATTAIPADSLLVSPPKFKIKKKSKVIAYDGVDGPYLVNDSLYWINEKNQLIKQSHAKSDSLLVVVDNKFQDKFYVKLKDDYEVPEDIYPLPEKLVAVSDIEGNYNAFAGFLRSNRVIDKNNDWIFSDGHLVLVGDFVDRGKNVTQVLWLIYKLENQAEKRGGKVHFILGNHEVLNFQGDHRYNQGKYIKVAQQISGERDKRKAVAYMYSDNTELGKWLDTKNVIEKIGGYLFVHAGLSKELLDYNLPIADINKKMHLSYDRKINRRDSVVRFLYGSKGPIWYRGLVQGSPKYSMETAQDLTQVLSFYDAEKVVIGHTFVNEVSIGLDGKVIRLDVPHGVKKFSGLTKGLLIENGKEFIIDDLGVKTCFD